MSVVGIRDKLNTALSDMQTLKQVFNYEPNEITQYPTAAISLKSGTGAFASTSANRRERQFSIKVYIEKGTNWSSQKSERITAEVIDEVEAHFDNNTTLSGTVQFVEAIDFDALYINRELNNRALDITINAMELTSTQ